MKISDRELAYNKCNLNTIYNKSEDYIPVQISSSEKLKEEKNAAKFKQMLEDDPIIDLNKLQQLYDLILSFYFFFIYYFKGLNIAKIIISYENKNSLKLYPQIFTFHRIRRENMIYSSARISLKVAQVLK